MSGSKLIVSKKEANLKRAERLWNDLLQVGPWRIDLSKIDGLKNNIDVSAPQNLFAEALLPDKGNEDEFIYRNCEGNIFIIWNKDQSVNTSDFSTWVKPSFMDAIDQVLSHLDRSIPEVVKVLRNINLEELDIPLAEFDILHKYKNYFPEMKYNYGICSNNGKLKDLYKNFEDGGSPSSSTHFIVYQLDKESLNSLLISVAFSPEVVLLSEDRLRCNLNDFHESMLTDSTLGHWDLYCPRGLKPEADRYELIELDENWKARDPRGDIRADCAVCVDFGTTGTVVAVRDNRGGRVSLLRAGAKGIELREGIRAEHYVNPTVLNFEHPAAIDAAWRDLPYRPRLRWADIQCSHQALDELPGKIKSGFYDIKTWARGREDRPRVLMDADNNELNIPQAPCETANDIAADYEKLPLNPIELYAYFLGLHLNTQGVEGGRIFTEYYMTFPARFDRATRRRILDGFRRGLLRSLPPSLIYMTDWDPASFKVVERASEPAALAAAILPLLPEEEAEEDAGGKEESVLNVENISSLKMRNQDDNFVEIFLGSKNIPMLKYNGEEPQFLQNNDIPTLIKRFRTTITLRARNNLIKISSDQAERILTHLVKKRRFPSSVLPSGADSASAAKRSKAAKRFKGAKLIQPTAEGVAFGVFDFGGGTTDIAVGLYRLASEEEEAEKGWEKVVDILSVSGDEDLGGEELIRLMVFETIKDNLNYLLSGKKDGKEAPQDWRPIPFEARETFPHLSGGEEIFDRGVYARENSRKLGEKLRPVWEKGGLLDTGEGADVISETFKDKGGTERPGVALKVNVPALRAMLKARVAQGVDKFFETFSQAFKKAGIFPSVLHIALAGNASQSDLVRECFRERIAELLKDNPGDDKIVLHPPLLPDPDNPEGVTLKTGVAIGLAESLPGLSVGMINREEQDGETAFPYTVGAARGGFLKPILKRASPYGQWLEFGRVFDEGVNRFYYSLSPLAMSGRLSKSECMEGRLDWGAFHKGRTIMIKAQSPDTADFALLDQSGKIDEGTIKTCKLK